MCGRATLSKKPAELEKRYQAKFIQGSLPLKNPLPNYNIAPTHWHPVVTNDARDRIQLFRWGLIPSWAKDHKIGSRLINARSETILEKPAFKAIHKRRCLVPFDGFYEWKRHGKQKIPYRIFLPETPVFSVAGIWETWRDSTGQTIPTFTLLTQPPNELMAGIHNRMPVILPADQEEVWLDSDLPAKEVVKIIAPLPDHLMKAYRVSGRVNKVGINDAGLINAVPDNPPNTLF